MGIFMVQTLRSSDSAAELEIGKFLDKYFYPIHAKNVTRYNDYEHQMKGLDVKLDYGNSLNLLVDEKAAAHYVNKGLPTFAFELNFLTTSGELVDGWFYDESKDTQYYLLSWIWANKDRNFSYTDITQLDIVLVERAKISSMLETLGLTKQRAMQKAVELRENGVDGVFDKSYGKPYYFYYSTRLAERPINVIIRKDKLIELSLCRHIIKPN